ncbi:hypothetical protein [Streptomyces sp. NPDC019937]|uniref:hypothetical protein n=1 Tax=Streptomyces sp. NPDC019937 TaxID=3154787 RepID=UPI0033F6C148
MAVEPRKTRPLPPADRAGSVSLYGLRDRTGRDDKPVKNKLRWADFQVRSGQPIQREPPVVSDHPAASATAPGPYAAGTVSRCDPELAALPIVLADDIRISLYRSSYR